MIKLKSLRAVLFVALLGQILGCKEAFDPSLETPTINFLVVEGFINTKGVTIIQLTRTQKLAEASTIKNELKATVQIENDNNLVVGLTESGLGIYKSEALNLPSDRKYRLRIKTAAGKEYLSEFTLVKTTPKLTLTWDQSSDGVRIYASTADPNNQTLFYKYDFEETWAQQSIALSEYVATVNPVNQNIGVSERNPPDQISALICWTSTLSNNILITSTKSLSSDVVDKLPVMFIPNGSEKLDRRYSILVKQYALTNEAYDFFAQMKKNTELLGSVFDPLPSTVRGNIKCVTDPSEPVVGNIVSASAEEQRIFITKQEAGNWVMSLACGIQHITNSQANRNLFFRNDKFLIRNAEFDETTVPRPTIIGYYITQPACLDCKKRGGNNIKPSYW